MNQTMPMVLARRLSHIRCMVTHTLPIKVFLVEDAFLVRDRVAQILRDRATDVVGQAQTPKEAIAGILASRPDVVVLDIQLECGTGLEVIRGVRLTLPQSIFVIFSNNSGPAYQKLYRMEGAVRFLDKSAEFDQLSSVNEQVARSAHQATTPSILQNYRSRNPYE